MSLRHPPRSRFATAALDAACAQQAFIAFLIGIIAAPWVANALVGVTPTR